MKIKDELSDGLVLDAEEFHKRYLRSDLRKVELVRGRVKMPSPVRFAQHSKPQGNLYYWLRTYSLRVGNVECGVEATVKLDARNQVQPDVVMLKVNGQCSVDDSDYIVGAPEFVGEVAASSDARDSTTKCNLYQEFKAKEYLIWKTVEQEVCWYRLVDDRYQRILPVNSVLRSVEFDGLCLDVTALIEGDINQVLSTLNTELERIGY